LSLAAQNGLGHAGVVEFLLEHPEIDVNARDSYGRAALSLAAQTLRGIETVPLLQHRNIEVDAMCPSRRTALSFAAERGHPDVLRLLLKHRGVRVNLKE